MFNYEVKRIEVEVGAGSCLGDVVNDLITLRRDMSADEVTFQFNGIALVVVAGVSAIDLTNQYQIKLQERK